MGAQLYNCPVCQATLSWYDQMGTDAEHFECPECNAKFYDVAAIKAQVMHKPGQEKKK